MLRYKLAQIDFLSKCGWATSAKGILATIATSPGQWSRYLFASTRGRRLLPINASFSKRLLGGRSSKVRRYALVAALVSSCIMHISVLRERYLRDDVGCGIDNCTLCPDSSDGPLPASGSQCHPSYPHGHFVLPDTNVFLGQVGSNPSLSYGGTRQIYSTCRHHLDGPRRVRSIHTSDHSPANSH